jgi:Na+/H+ antiporter NhaC
MTLEIIVFISAILFGILWYWRESRSNRTFRMLNKITHAKHLQMKPDDSKGFLHQQNFLLRLVYISLLFLAAALAVMALTPISIASVQLFVACIVGTLIGSYVASAVLFANKKITENSDIVEDTLEDTFDKGKTFVNDLRGEHKPTPQPKETVKQEEITPKKNARERLRDKGYLD